MSAPGQTRSSRLAAGCLLRPPKADIGRTFPEVRFVPNRTHAVQQSEPLFDHLVRAEKERGWNFDLQRLGGLLIDNELKARRLLDGDIVRLGTA
jgi:hypothetical protein